MIAETSEAWDEIEVELWKNDPANYGNPEGETGNGEGGEVPSEDPLLVPADTERDDRV